MHRLFMALVVFFGVSVTLTFSVLTHAAAAVQSVPYQMNFQGRLNDSTGAPMASGTYNMKFRIYSVSTGGSALWSEQRSVFSGTGVTVTGGGLFSVELGSVTALPSSIFNSPSALYLEIELPTPATATCSTSGCESYTEGAMTPRNSISSSPYAINSDLLDGLDSTAFAASSGSANYIQNGTSAQSASFNINGTGAIGGTLSVGGALTTTVNNTSALLIQNASNVAALTVDTTTNTITIGSAASGNYLIFTPSGGLVANGTARHTKTILLTPEYGGAVLDASSDATCSSANTGTMTSGYDSTNRTNYYNWTSSQASAQCYDVVVQVPIPSDFTSWSGTPDIEMIKDSTGTAAYAIQIVPSSGTDANYNTYVSPATLTTSWANMATTALSGTYTAGNYLTVKVRVSSTSSANVKLGNIKLTYNSSF